MSQIHVFDITQTVVIHLLYNFHEQTSLASLKSDSGNDVSRLRVFASDTSTWTLIKPFSSNAWGSLVNNSNFMSIGVYEF